MKGEAARDRPWMRRPGLAGMLDGATVAVLLLWGVLMALLPYRPPPVDDMRQPSAPDCLIRAWTVPLSALSPVLRPDLIALPSAFSFGLMAMSEDTLFGVPELQFPMARPLSVPAAGTDTEHDAGRRFAAQVQVEAARQAVRLLSPVAWDMPIPSPSVSGSPPAWRVLYRNGKKPPGQLHPEAIANPEDGSGGRAWEIELEVELDERGSPVQIFLEQGSGDPALDRERLRQLWNPDCWSGNMPGWVRVWLRYQPAMGR